MEWSELDNKTVGECDKPLLVDYRGPGEVLAVCFGAFEPERLPPFEFFGRLKKIEKISGRKVNKILVRDTSNSWYHYGVPGLGCDIADTISRLRDLISQTRPSRVVTLGQSMGAFGAVLYGALLDVDEAIAFGPLAVFNSALSARFSDERWSDVIKPVEAAPPRVFYRDLPRLIDSLSIRTRFHVYYGTKPTDDPRDKMKYVEAVNYDAVHGFLYGQSARVEARPVRWSTHRIPAYLRQIGFIDDLMLHRILGLPYVAESFEDLPIDPGWIHWMEVNYAMGFDADLLLPQVRLSCAMTKDVLATAFNRARRNVLRRML
jgi:pimeloyl-ACP methyl ester carboxylesterase